MGGDLTLSSAPGRGTSLRFRFRARSVAAPDAPPPSVWTPLRLASDSPQPRVLIVDDVRSNRDILLAMLAEAGLLDVREAADGAAAIAAASAWEPDLILMDRRMPGVDGLAALAALRAGGGAQARIVVVSASAFEEDRQAALAAGADGFVGKPFSEQAVFAEIQRLCPALPFEPAAPPAPPAPPAQEAPLDDSARTRLIELIESGDVLRFDAYLRDHVAQRHPALHRQLHELVQRFDYGRILALLHAKES